MCRLQGMMLKDHLLKYRPTEERHINNNYNKLENNPSDIFLYISHQFKHNKTDNIATGQYKNVIDRQI